MPSSPFSVLLGGPLITQAQVAMEKGDAAQALEWLNRIPEDRRPPELAATVYYQISKDGASRGEWQSAEKHLTLAAANSSLPLYQRRLALVRRRTPLIVDQQWET